MARIDNVSVKNIKFDALKYGVSKALGNNYMSDQAEVDTYGMMGESMAIVLRTKVLAYNFENHTTTIKVSQSFDQPATWWDALKQEKFPVWLKDRFPVQTRTITKTARRKVTFSKYATYPDAPVLPKQGWFWPVGYDAFIREEDPNDQI